MTNDYDDNYSTCKETSAAFRIIHPALDPDTISQQLGLRPSWAWRKGQPRGRRNIPSRSGIWGLDTEGVLTSRDLRRHLDWLLDQLEPKAEVLEELRGQGYAMDIFCLWCRLGGTGGPILSARNMARLAALNLTLGFEFWAVDEDEENGGTEEPASEPSKTRTPE
jgi:uncharacterized protein DUF4279